MRRKRLAPFRNIHDAGHNDAAVATGAEFVQKLSQAKNLEDVVKIQTEFMSAQLSSFNEQAKDIGEIYTRTATAMRTPFGLST